jgi:hypothetical protein
MNSFVRVVCLILGLIEFVPRIVVTLLVTIFTFGWMWEDLDIKELLVPYLWIQATRS